MTSLTNNNWWKRKITGLHCKSSFRYWSIHWWEYQEFAFRSKRWKVWDIFHDWYKPWLNLFMPYKWVQKIHKSLAFHHPENIFHIYERRATLIDIYCGIGSRVKLKEDGDSIKKLLQSGYFNKEYLEQFFK